MLRDVSRSTTTEGVPDVTAEDVAQLADEVRRCGGAVMVGLISRDSRRSLVRISRPVPPGVAPLANAGNVFLNATARRRHDADLADYNRKVSEHLEAFDRERETFDAAVAALLAMPRTDSATDLDAAIARALLALREPGHPAQARRVLVAATDGAHTSKRTTTWDGTGVEVFIAGAAGSLAVLDPYVFENTSAAVRSVDASQLK